MGIFEGVLIASDWDGTLFCNGTVPIKTREAIDRFMSLGGRFAISSGRSRDYLLENSHLIKPNTYCICYGGSLICDIESGSILREGFLDGEAFEVIDKILAFNVNITKMNVFRSDGLKQYTPKEYLSSGMIESMSANVYKVAFSCSDSDEGDKLKALCDSLDHPSYTLARSFSSYIELMRTEYTKGVSARILKEKLNARLLVGMGDYENDIPLFEKCDISFAVAGAVDSLKRIATYTTRATVEESAAAEVIESLEWLIIAKDI